MVIISGRRRIGKTTLANPAFTNGPLPCRFFHISDEKTAKTNVEAFWRFNAATLGLEYFPPPAATIAGTIEFLLKQSAKTPMTVVLDEFQNAETVEPALVTDLSVLWDKYRKDTQLLLVLTVSDGAGRSMTDDRFSPLCARACGELTLRPFSTGVIKTILTEHYPTRKPDDLLTLFAVTGGIPQYIKVLTEAGCTSARRMIRSVAQPRSYFQREAETLLKTAFKSDCQVYFELLQRIAEGKSRRSGLVSYFRGQSIDGHLFRLEKHFRLIERERPLGASKTTDYRRRLTDTHLAFWFRFLYPYQALIEQGATERLEEQILKTLPEHTGHHVLTTLSRTKLAETGPYTEIGPWWDKTGENDIDSVAVNTFGKKILFAEVKPQKSGINLTALQLKSAFFLQRNKALRTSLSGLQRRRPLMPPDC